MLREKAVEVKQANTFYSWAPTKMLADGGVNERQKQQQQTHFSFAL